MRLILHQFQLLDKTIKYLDIDIDIDRYFIKSKIKAHKHFKENILKKNMVPNFLEKELGFMIGLTLEISACEVS